LEKILESYTYRDACIGFACNMAFVHGRKCIAVTVPKRRLISFYYYRHAKVSFYVKWRNI